MIFAVLRGVFAFLQAYWAERNSQSVAFDLRNDLFAKIQRLSFSYHDRNQTGQLMIRATDDVEKVRLFIGQGLLQLVGALLLHRRHADHPVHHQRPPGAGRRCRSCRSALIMFMIFGTISQPLFAKVQQQPLGAEHHPAGEPGRHQGGQGLHAREERAGQVRTRRPTS